MSRVDEVFELHERGFRNVEIARQLGIAASTVGTYLKRAGEDDDPVYESPRMARERVQSEVAAGKRCWCCLLIPCADHQP